MQVVKLLGRLYHDLSAVTSPIASFIPITWVFHKNKDSKLINTDGDDKFRIKLNYFELYTKRLILAPNVHAYLEKRMLTQPLQYMYTRFDVTSHQVDGNLQYYER